MHRLLRRLKLDHKNLVLLLAVLQKQLDDFHDGSEHDTDLTCELVEYLASYEDQVHHPTEELVFARLRELSDEHRAVLDRLQEEHHILIVKNKRFADSLEAIMHGGVLLRADLEAEGRDLLQMLRAHMDLEENTAFTAAVEHLSEEDWDAIEERAPKLNDPVFGKPDPARFQTLFKHLTVELDLNK
jgi:hemerythrin-like domain-containing protein